MTDDAAKKDVEAEEKILSPEAQRYLCDMREKAYYDYKSGMYSATQKGIERGIEQGIEQERTQTAERLFGMGMSVEIICKATELSSEKVEEIRQRLMRKS